MAYFTRLGLLLVAPLCYCTTGYAQSSPDTWLEAECTVLVGSDYVPRRDYTASNKRYVTPRRKEDGTPIPPTEDFLRYSVYLDELPDSSTSLAVYGRLRTILSATDFLRVRINSRAWTTFAGSLAVADTFAWYAAPVRLTGLEQGFNILDVALPQPGTQLDNIFTTITDRVPTGLGGPPANCDASELNLPPVAIARAEPDGGTAPLTVLLDGSQSFDDDGVIKSYTWAWAGGGYATGATPTVTLAAGTYTLTLTVTDDFGASATSEVTIPVIDLETTPDTQPETAFWLEAECAAVGEYWTTVQPDLVSGGQAVVVRKLNARATPPADLPANRVRFTLDRVLPGSYHLFARIDAPDNHSDSYWVRINGGPWFSWSSGMHQGLGYVWNRYPAGTIDLAAGTNYIDFAFREAGTALDKLHLNQTGALPSGYGTVATNCSLITEADTRFSLEAECAQRGAGWQPVTSPLASGEKYTVFLGPNGLDVPATVDPRRALTFPINVTKAATYFGFIRLDAPDPGSNSLWLRVDAGTWIKMNQEISGDPLRTDGFAWRAVADAGLPVSFDLGVGPHTITVVNRESNTRLDKLYLSTAPMLPDGLGIPATNCSTPPPVVSFPGGPLGPAVRLPVADLSIYPNPTHSTLSLRRSSEYTGPVTIRISDFTGRQLRLLSVDKPGTQLTQTLDLSDLPAGMYRLQLLEGRQPTVVPFVKQ